MVEKKSVGNTVFNIAVCVLTGAVSLVCLYPMLYVLFASFSDPAQLISHVGVLYKPLGFSTLGYQVVFKNPNVPIGYMNTLFYVAAGTAINILMTTLAAYALSRKGYKLKKAFTLGIVVTMYIGGGMIPNFLLVRNLGLLNTRLALLLPGAIATWNMIVMRTAFNAIPASLEESAKIDGANDFVILFRIFIPVAKATLAVMVLYYSVGHWNAWFNAMIYLKKRELWPLQLFLREILVANSSGGNTAGSVIASADSDFNYLDEVIKYALIIISTVPILCFYPFIQKYFNKGVMMGSLKE
ncbi:MAG: carbohydrate ABC transporter permease [Provencibacterium sp.]|nr:carbohydrate ABC transporter permease [Provencibacterium sp.]